MFRGHHQAKFSPKTEKEALTSAIFSSLLRSLAVKGLIRCSPPCSVFCAFMVDVRVENVNGDAEVADRSEGRTSVDPGGLLISYQKSEVVGGMSGGEGLSN
jgi:hypothetical protein